MRISVYSEILDSLSARRKSGVRAALDSEIMMKLYSASKYSDGYRIVKNMVNFSSFGGSHIISLRLGSILNALGSQKIRQRAFGS